MVVVSLDVASDTALTRAVRLPCLPGAVRRPWDVEDCSSRPLPTEGGSRRCQPQCEAVTEAGH